MLVREGQSVVLSPDRDGNPNHIRGKVYGEMMLLIAQRYPGLPDVRDLTFEEIEFFYEGIRVQLEHDTKPMKGRK